MIPAAIWPQQMDAPLEEPCRLLPPVHSPPGDLFAVFATAEHTPRRPLPGENRLCADPKPNGPPLRDARRASPRRTTQRFSSMQ
jgi:hypothetical protein